MKKLSLIIAVVFNLQGCAAIDQYFDGENPKQVFHTNWEKNEAKRFIEGKYDDKYLLLGCSVANAAAKAERDKQLDSFILGVDAYYYVIRHSLLSGVAFENTFADIVQLGLTSVASFAGGGTPNLLAAIATAINGSKLSIDKNFLADHSSLLVASKMDQLRSTKMNEINKKKAFDCIEYSLDAAMKDAIDYFYAGTPNGAILAIFNETGKDMQDAQKDELKIVNERYKKITGIDTEE